MLFEPARHVHARVAFQVDFSTEAIEGKSGGNADLVVVGVQTHVKSPHHSLAVKPRIVQPHFAAVIGIDGFSFSNDTFLGNSFVMINAISFSVYLVLVKPLMLRYKPLTIIKWVFFFGMIAVVPFGTKEFLQVEWQQLPADAWYSLVYIIIGTTFIAYLLNTWALQYVSPSVVGYYIYLQPVFATFIAIVFRGDQLTINAVFYASLIFLGVYFVSIKKSISR